MRHDNFADNAARDGVRQHPFETVSDFDAQFAIIADDKENCAVVKSFLADLPVLTNSDTEIFESVPFKVRYGEYCYLMPRLALELSQLFFQAARAVGRQQPGEIIHLPAQRRHFKSAR